MSRHDCRRCDWKPEGAALSDRVQLLEHSQSEPVRHPLCIVCASSLPWSSPQTCLPCLADTRRVLAEVVDLYALLPAAMRQAVYGQPSAPRDGPQSSEQTFPGGDRLAMLAGGSRGLAQFRTGDEGAEQVDDPESVAFELGRWEDDWRLVREESAAEVVGTVSSAVAYLMPRMGWAADSHDAFDEFVVDVRRLVSRLRTSVGTDVRPRRGVPCLTCDATLERKQQARRNSGRGCLGHWDRCDWPYEPHGCTDSGGLVDDWTCPKCGRVYGDEAYRRAVAQRYALARGGLVTAATVEETLGVRQGRLRVWATRGEVSRRGHDERGRTLYDAEEVRRHAEKAGLLPAAGSACNSACG